MSSYNHLPEGTYTCEILEISDKQDNKNHPRMIWRLRVVEGACKYQEIEKTFHLTSTKAIECLKNELKTLGVEAKNGEDFETKKHGLIGQRIVIEAVINDHGFHVYYVKGVAETVLKQYQHPTDLGW